ncbi:MAG: DNA alkylation repair protein [Bacteroidota bacterium]
MKEVEEIIAYFEKNASEKNRLGMAHFGVNVDNAYGMTTPTIRVLAKDKRFKKNHELAIELWKTNKHEARLLAGMIADPKKMTGKLMEEWVLGFNSWDVCDCVCMSCFTYTKDAYEKALSWANRDEEYVRRAGFVIMAMYGLKKHAYLAVDYAPFWELMLKYSVDERNFVKKAINWALRQLGKRNEILNKKAIEIAELMLKFDSKSAKWIATDALRELRACKVHKVESL